MNNIIVFYDAQNFNNVRHFDPIEKAILRHGKISVVRIYHDFVGKDNAWKHLCFARGMKPCQITSPKKNTADLLITIDALKIAYSNKEDIFCFVTNDSDFYPISLELKQMGITTMLVTSKAAYTMAQVEDYCFSIVERVDFTTTATVSNNAKTPSISPKAKAATKAQESNASVAKSQDSGTVGKAQDVARVQEAASSSIKSQDSGTVGKAQDVARVQEAASSSIKSQDSTIAMVIDSINGALAVDDNKADELKQLPGKLKQYISSRYGQLKKDEGGWASYATLCSGLKKKYGDIDYKTIGYKDKKDYIVKCGYEVVGKDFRQKK